MNPCIDTVTGVQEAVHQRRDRFLELLQELVEHESPSRIPQSQEPVFECLEKTFSNLGLESRRVPGTHSGGCCIAGPDREDGFQLIVGHVDTVWPEGTLQRLPWGVDGNQARGPGVYDMKAGLVQALLALEVLQALNLEPVLPTVLLINSDEEIGSNESRSLIEQMGGRAARAFVLEPSLEPGSRIKTSRKGVGRFQIRIQGKASHAGLAPEKGISAILELSHVVQSLFALSDPEQGVTVNVGTIDGGVSANVVAPASSAEVEVRVPTQALAGHIKQALQDLPSTVPGSSIEISGEFDRPPMEKTEGGAALWATARNLGQQLGLELEDGLAGGASDGNLIYHLTPTLDGLGAVGNGAHADHEHILIDETLDRCALLALLLLSPPDELA